MENTEISYVIERSLGVIGEPSRAGWTKELNLVSWNGREAKFDLREWAPGHEKMVKGLTLTRPEAEALYRLLGAALR